MLSLKYSSRFKKDFKNYQHDKEIIDSLKEVVDILLAGKKLPQKNHNHQLSGQYKNCFECHLKPDVLLIYKVEESEITILLLRIGSHSKLF